MIESWDGGYTIGHHCPWRSCPRLLQSSLRYWLPSLPGMSGFSESYSWSRPQLGLRGPVAARAVSSGRRRSHAKRSSHREGHPDGGRSTIAVGGHRLSWLGPIAAARLPLLGPWPAPALRVRLPPDTGRLAARMMLTVLLTTALECCGRIGTTHRSGSRSGDDPGRLWTRPILLLIRW
jgi:hypothetical protein